MRNFKPDASPLRLDIIESLARSQSDLLTPAERAKVADSIDPDASRRHQSRHQPANLIAASADQRRYLPQRIALTPAEQQELNDITEYLRLHSLRGDGDFREMPEKSVMSVLAQASPNVMDAIVTSQMLVQNLDETGGRRTLFDPNRVDMDRLSLPPGIRNIAGKVETERLSAVLADRMDASDPEHVRAARAERERPNRERHDLRESIENAHVSHELFNTGASNIPDASQAFREQAPSVRASVTAVANYLDEKGGA